MHPSQQSPLRLLTLPQRPVPRRLWSHGNGVRPIVIRTCVNLQELVTTRMTRVIPRMDA